MTPRIIGFEDKNKREMYLDSTVFNSVQKLIQESCNWKSLCQNVLIFINVLIFN